MALNEKYAVPRRHTGQRVTSRRKGMISREYRAGRERRAFPEHGVAVLVSSLVRYYSKGIVITTPPMRSPI